MSLVRRTSRGLLRDGSRSPELQQACRQILERVVQLLPDLERRICLIASPTAHEGRTSLALNLATVAAGAARASVLVIDADSAAPRLHEALGLSRGPGLSDVLAGGAKCTDVVRPIGEGRLHALTVGSADLDPTALSDAQSLRRLFDELRTRYTWIFVDTAPLIAAPTGAVVARHVDGVLYAVRYGRTRGLIAAQGLALLDEAGARTLGVVITQRCFVIPSYVYRRL